MGIWKTINKDELEVLKKMALDVLRDAYTKSEKRQDDPKSKKRVRV